MLLFLFSFFSLFLAIVRSGSTKFFSLSFVLEKKKKTSRKRFFDSNFIVLRAIIKLISIYFITSVGYVFFFLFPLFNLNKHEYIFVSFNYSKRTINHMIIRWLCIGFWAGCDGLLLKNDFSRQLWRHEIGANSRVKHRNKIDKIRKRQCLMQQCLMRQLFQVW